MTCPLCTPAHETLLWHDEFCRVIWQPVGLWNLRLQTDRAGPFFAHFLANSPAIPRRNGQKLVSAGPVLAIGAQSPTGCQVDEAAYPGFCRVILNAHVREMSDLPAADRVRLLRVVCAVEEAVRAVARPDKINLASLGNMVPHLHWHVIPRWETDRTFPDAIWAAPRRDGKVPSGDGWRELLAERLGAGL